MKCPKCEESLNINEGEGHIGFICEKCKGMWLSCKYITSLQHSNNFELSNFIQALSEKYVSTELTCPGCNTKLNHSTFNKIELEWCSTCKGIWFDQHELNTLIKLYEKDKTPGEKIFIGFELLALFFSS